MLSAIRERLERSRGEGGFTLIELMVVVLIIAILIAIAIPTFLGARQRAQDRAAQSDIRNAFTAEKTYYTDNQVYTATPADLTAIEPSLQYVAGAGSQTAVGVAVSASGAAVCLEKVSRSGRTFALYDLAVGAGAGTYYNRGACPASVTDTPPTGWGQNGW
jgi:type IV pilus assembly protein PilA